MTAVSIVKNPDAKVSVMRALDLLGGIKAFVKPTDRVFVKPNICGGWVGEKGSMTSMEVLVAILDILREAAGEIVVGEADGSFNRADSMFQKMNLHEIAQRYDASVVNLSKDEKVHVNLPDAYVLKSLEIAKSLYECDVVINVPVLKSHPWTQVTLSLKNMFGALSEVDKVSYHAHLDEVIVDVNRIVKSKVCIVDGIYAAPKGMFSGGLWVANPPVKMDVIIAGSDPVAVDTVAAKILGFYPTQIPHIKLAAKRGLGVCTSNEIKIISNGMGKPSGAGAWYISMV